MSNLFSYCLNYGSISFKDLPFNEIDALIFARLSYIDFSLFLTKSKFRKIKLVKILNKIYSSKEYKKIFRLNSDYKLFKLVQNSNRYKHIYLYRYISINEEESLTQFGAISILNKEFKNKFIVVSFKGTDGTLLGWKEDFKMALANINAQTLASSYLKSSLPLFSKTKCKVVGHSKGGNLAIYSSSTIKDKDQNKISDIFVFDSPGFKDEFYKETNFINIRTKIKAFLPNESIIGRLLNINYPYTIISSNDRLLNQHDIYNWKISQKTMVNTTSFSKISNIITSLLNERIEKSNDEELNKFIDKIFEILERMGDGIHLKNDDESILKFLKKLSIEILNDKDSRTMFLKFIRKKL